MVYKPLVSRSFRIEEDLGLADVFSVVPEFHFCPEVKIPPDFLDLLD